MAEQMRYRVYSKKPHPSFRGVETPDKRMGGYSGKAEATKYLRSSNHPPQRFFVETCMRKPDSPTGLEVWETMSFVSGEVWLEGSTNVYL